MSLVLNKLQDLAEFRARTRKGREPDPDKDREQAERYAGWLLELMTRLIAIDRARANGGQAKVVPVVSGLGSRLARRGVKTG
jgi:hypothetical protein